MARKKQVTTIAIAVVAMAIAKAIRAIINNKTIINSPNTD